MHHYPHNIGDFDKATRHLTRIERSIYRDLIERYYDTEQMLTLDIASLCRFVLAHTSEEITAVEQTLNEFFIKTPNGWYHKRCEAELEKYRANTSQKALAGKASALAKLIKAQQMLNGTSTHVEQMNNGIPTKQNGERGTGNGQTETVKQNQEDSKTKSKVKNITPSAFVLPDWINKTHWDLWVSIRKKMDNDQKQMQVNKLERWKKEGLDFAGALENAAANGSQGLFLPSGNKAIQRKMPIQDNFADKDYGTGVNPL